MLDRGPIQAAGIVEDGVPPNPADKPPLPGSGIRLLEPEVHRDDRGWFSEVFSEERFQDATGEDARFVQDNQSSSRQGVLRGLHYQVDPMAQGKLVRVVRGSIFDVVVDLRRSSPGFGTWAGFELSAENLRQVWIPPGFAHGFLALSDPADVVYKVTQYYSPEHERALRWDDPDVSIDWPINGHPTVSARDEEASSLRDADVFR